MHITSTTLSTLLGGWSEGQIVLLVLGVLVVGVAMLSYFVIAPEYEKHLTKEYETHDNRKSGSFSSCKQPEVDRTVTGELMKTTFSDDENDGMDSDHVRLNSMNNKAEMLRRRVLLRKLEQEIDGAIHETQHNNTQKATTTVQPRHVGHSSMAFTAERLNEIQNHPADCTPEVELLERMTKSMKHSTTMKQALELIHDVLSYHLSSEHRDMNKVTVLCNSLLKHDGLNHLRQLEHASDVEVRKLANDIIEKAVPAIWH